MTPLMCLAAAVFFEATLRVGEEVPPPPTREPSLFIIVASTPTPARSLIVDFVSLSAYYLGANRRGRGVTSLPVEL